MVKPDYSLNIGWFYPELMSTYGDFGNIITLKSRATWAGIKVNVINIETNSHNINTNDIDLIFMGGAQDRQQTIVGADLLADKQNVIKDLFNKKVPGLFICGAYQLLGKYYKTADNKVIKGLGVFNIFTEQPSGKAPRLIGDITISSLVFPDLPIVGFENHGGRTYLDDKSESFGKVVAGNGNNGKDGTEGTVSNNFIGTYLHGPILPFNPDLADWLISKAIEVKYKKKPEITFAKKDLELFIRNSR